MPRSPKNNKSPLGALLQSLKADEPKAAKTAQPHPAHRQKFNRSGSSLHARAFGHKQGARAHGHAEKPAHGHTTHSHAAPHTAGHGHAHAAPAKRGDDSKQRRGNTFQYSKFGAKRGAKATAFRTMTKETPNGSKEPMIPPPAPGVIRIIPIGGVEEIGKNMTLVEIGNDIIIIDAGFQFKTEETPGIDYIVPNTKYLEERKDKIRGMVITHGHMDHIGGIPYIIEKLGYPPIYTRRLTSIMIEKRQAEFPHLKPLDIKLVEKEDRIKLGEVYIRFFAVSHSIPDSMGVIIETPYGNILGTGDLRVDNRGGIPTEAEEKSFTALGQEKNLFLMMDSTNATNPGFSLAESLVVENIDAIIRDVSGRLIIGTFASQLQRVMDILNIVEKYGKKVVIEGRSMKTGVDIVTEMGLLKLKPNTIIDVSEVENYPDNKIVVVATGSQGEEFAAIMRISNKTHKFIRLRKGDTVLLSSSVIPGNELGVQKVKDNLSRQGAKIIHYKISEIHASGHANAEELLWMHKKIKSKFFMPVHGYHYMLSVHADIARAAGTAEENVIIPDNGSIVEIYDEGTKVRVLKEKAPSSIVMVDGFSVGDMQEVVIRDRQMLAQDGMFVIVATVDANTGALRKSPDIISRGFVYLKESQDLLHESRRIIKKSLEDGSRGQNPINFEYIKNQIGENLSKFLYQKTAKRPLIIPVLLAM
jgi:ribonuclease J